METFDAVIYLNRGIHKWAIPLTIGVSFCQTVRQSWDSPAEYEVNDFKFESIGHQKDQRDYDLLEDVVMDELDSSGLENVELL